MSVNNYERQQVLTLEECSIEESSDEPKGMSQFMRSIKEKSKKLVFPALVYLGGTAGSVVSLATGGPIAAPAVIALGAEIIKLLCVMKDANSNRNQMWKLRSCFCQG